MSPNYRGTAPEPSAASHVAGCNSGAAIADAAEHTIIPAVSGLRINIEAMTITNKSASVSTTVQILDGPGGAIRHIVDAQKDGGGEMFKASLVSPIKLTAGNALVIKCGTTGAEVYVNAYGFLSAE